MRLDQIFSAQVPFVKTLLEGFSQNPSKLTEADWYDQSPLTDILRKYQGKGLYIHFTNGAPNRFATVDGKPTDDSRNVAKIGINPVMGLSQAAKADRGVYASHKDPIGVYLYPVDFLLSGTERLRRGQQYGTDMRFFFIVKVEGSRNGIDLRWVTEAEIEALAVRNGWQDELYAFKAMSPADQAKHLPHYYNPQYPGSFLWHFLDRLVKDGKISWNKALKGVDYIRDPGLAIIHSNEPDQMLVINPRLIKVVDSGENTPIRASGGDPKTQWKTVRERLLKGLRAEFGGDLTFKDKAPTLTFTVGKTLFTATLGDRYDVPTLNIAYRFGRAVGTIYISDTIIRDEPLTTVIEKAKTEVERIARRKSDLLFTPVISEKDAQALFRRIGAVTWEFKTEINNDGGRYNGMIITGTHQGADDPALLTRIVVTVGTEDIRISGTVAIMGTSIASLYLPQSERIKPEEVEKAFDELASRYAESLRNHFDYLRPGKSGWRARFYDDADADAALGWVALHAGVTFEDRVRRELAPEIKAFTDRESKGGLLSDIRYTHRKW